jgi:DNA-binding HxlR family transcriptional regulator
VRVTLAQARRASSISHCALTAAIAAAGDKWKVIIFFWLAESPRQFGQMRQLLSGISQKVLAEQLREPADVLETRTRAG